MSEKTPVKKQSEELHVYALMFFFVAAVAAPGAWCRRGPEGA